MINSLSLRFLLSLTFAFAGCRSARQETRSSTSDAGQGASTPSTASSVAAAVETKPPRDPVSVSPTSRLRANGAKRLAFTDAQHLGWSAEPSLDVTVVDVAAHRDVLHLHAASRRALPSEGVTALAASPTVILSAASGSVRSWDAKKGTPLHEFLPVEPKRLVNRLVRLRDDTIVASVIPDRSTFNETIEIYRWAADGTSIFHSTLPTAGPWLSASAGGFALSPDGSQIATGVDQIVVFDGKSGASLGKPFGYVKEDGLGKPTIRAIGWLESGVVAYSAASFVGDVEAMIYAVRSNAAPLVFEAHRGSLEEAALFADGRLVTAGRDDKHVTVRGANGVPECELTGVQGAISALAMSQDEQRIAVATDKEILVWDLAHCAAPAPPSNH